MMRYLAVLVPLLAITPAHAQDAYSEVLRWAQDPRSGPPAAAPGQKLWGTPPAPLPAAPNPKAFSTVRPERALTPPPPSPVHPSPVR